MKLYLTSNGIPDITSFTALFDKPLTEVQMAFIVNAKDYYNERLRRFKIEQGLAKYRSLGLQVTEIDLHDYHGKSEKLHDILSKYDVVWAYGGNTFCLRDEMHESGFDTIIADLLTNKIVYGGESAGAIVAGKSLRGIEVADFPVAAEHVVWDGMSLVDAYIVPHADGANYIETVANTRQLFGDMPNYIELNDNQALIIDDEHKQIVVADN